MTGLRTLHAVIRNLLSGWAAIAVSGAVAIVMVPFLLRHIGTEGHGLACLLMVIVGLSSIADYGLRGALGRELPERVAQNDNSRVPLNIVHRPRALSDPGIPCRRGRLYSRPMVRRDLQSRR